jgi:hypothetical protein
MIVNLPLLVLGVLLLWFPRGWLRLGLPVLRRRRRRGERSKSVEPWRAREPGDPHVSFATEFRKFRNFIDLLRAGAASLVFAGGMGIPPSLVAEPGAPRAVVWQIVALRAAILLVGVLIQTIRVERGRVSFYPPIFYLAGLSIGLCDIRGAAFAFALMWALNTGLPNSQGFLSVYALLLVAFGHLFARRGDLSAVYAGILAFVPVLLSLLAKKPLTIMSRKAPRPTAHT